MTTPSKLLALILLQSSLTMLIAETHRYPQPKEPASFCSVIDCGVDSPFQNAPNPSHEVLQALLSQTEVRDALQNSDRSRAAQLFKASTVHLGPSKETDLIISGDCPLCGADNNWFWVVRLTPRGPRVVLFAHTLRLDLLTNTTRGFRDIHCSWASAGSSLEEQYQFDGSQYKLIKEERAAPHP